MTSTPSLAPPARPNRVPTSAPSGILTCRRCGGSGILRLADGRFRTCLDCLGQGITREPRAGADLTSVGGSAHPRSLRSPDEEGSRTDNGGQGSSCQQQQDDGGPVCVHPCR
jgi:hypothetical protein